MIPISSQRLLSIWEQGDRLHPIDRSLLLFSLARPELEPDQLPDLPLGTCNASLLHLQRDNFNKHLPAWVDCPSCGERMEFDLGSMQFPPAPDAKPDSVEVMGLSFKLPTSRDLARIAGYRVEADRCGQILFEELAEQAHQLPADSADLESLQEQVEAAIEAADPWANLSLALQCPACGTEDEAEFDVAHYLWDAIDSRAQRLLDDIHCLAQAYGWSESEILELSDGRRRSYLQRLFS